ncbi:hypothetical protein IU443_21655 [Nocardia farcinica]|uniref:hypothetical protein n=1 Tax=Nocardia farcinica TaxID=37329 RepID=UPI001895C5F8|nr:hypothetical protein [Nocardia farcinica]MBF6264880.1 hypothetical protein [Nocardia farcinica]MBF6283666.1 hypothetical protein [Nocardia farcinica]MBF6307381.1 hypothetical protein [Nocardia farcinica]MBF6392553.1 hypothetical protein [Nocardia farcinica]MBF6490564.1 hypothetical protein [Nocardia farcinica]
MNDDVDANAQDDPEWVVWSSNQHTADAIYRLFTETLPRVPIGGERGWRTPAGEPVGPMPQGVDRYSDEMALYWISDVFDFFLPDEDALYEPARAEVVTQFVCYIGEYFIRHCEGRWINEPGEKVLYRFGPTIRYDWTGIVDNPEDLLFSAVEEGDFRCVTSEWFSRTIDYAEAHGTAHEGLDIRRKHRRD